jgi:putative aldouronate transport system permease protein
LLLVLIVSLTSENSIALYGYTFFPHEWTLSAYDYVFKDPQLLFQSYGNTIFSTVFGTLICLCITSMLAYPLSRKTLPFRKFFTFFVVFTILFNGGLVPWYIVMKSNLHFSDNIWALVVPGLLLNGFNVLIMRTFFKNTIPPELIEAANMDGAGELRIFAQIVIPLSKPVFATIGLFATLGYWNDYWNSMIFQIQPKNFSIQYVLQNILLNIQFLSQSRSSNASAALANIPQETSRMAMAIIAIGPIIFAYPFFQKFIIKGLTIGAVKG